MKISGAVAALSALALMAACTPSSSDPSATRKDAAAAASPEPVFRVSSVADSEETSPESGDAEAKESAAEAKESAAEAKESDPASSAVSSPTPSPGGAPSAGDPVASGSEIDLDAGKRIHLSVEGAVLKDISIVDPDHPHIAVDPGTFFDESGAALDSEDPEAGGLTSTDEPESAESGDTTDSPAPTESASTKVPSTESASSSSDETEASTLTAPDEATAWTSEFDLVAASTYDVTATATTPDGKDHEFTASAELAEADGEPMSVRTVLTDDQTVGVAAPIILTFGSTVAKKYRDDVERRITVEVTDEDGKEREVEGSWAWLPDDPQSRLHFRPKEYWPAHSQVSVDAPLKNVPTAQGRVGENDLTLDFEIGREQIVEASAKTHRMTVTRDGKEIMDFPASLGAAKSPSYNGTHVVMSKHADYTMRSERWNYATPVQWAVRIHNNGEFVHAAPWSAGVQGSANVSHGCINLTTQRAKEYYDSAIYGDPVEVTGSGVSLSTEDSDISDWVYDWDDWKKMSALN